MKLNIYVLLLIFLVILMYFQPSFLGNLCTNCFGKATLVLLIVFLAIQDIGLAILASVVLISSIHLVSREGFKEGNTGIAGICKRVLENGGLEEIPGDTQSNCLINGTCHEAGSNSYASEFSSKSPSVLQSQCDGIGTCTKSDGGDLELQDRREKACLHHTGTCDNNNATTGDDCDNSFTCSDPTYTDKATCEGAGKCIDDDGEQVPGITTEIACTSPGTTWTPNTYSPSIWTSDNTWNDLQYEWKRHTWDVSTQPNLGCDSYQEHINDDNAHSIHQHVSGFRNRKGGKEGFMVSSSELISFEDSKIRGKDSNIYPVSRSNVQNKGLFSGFNLF